MMIISFTSKKGNYLVKIAPKNVCIQMDTLPCIQKGMVLFVCIHMDTLLGGQFFMTYVLKYPDGPIAKLNIVFFLDEKEIGSNFSITNAENNECGSAGRIRGG